MAFLSLILALLVHPVHETVTEVQWNPQTRRMEVAVRLDIEDEQWIKTKVGGGDQTPIWAIRYLQKRVRITNPPEPKSSPESKVAKDSATYHWIGRDRDGAHVWWYFEIQPTDGKRPEWIDCRLLFDREPDFLHRLLLLNHTPPRAMNLTATRSRVRLDAAADTVSPGKTNPKNTTDHDEAPLPPTDL
ncbi:DUF6702 family protein [Rubripirellula reticaptiva]|uniref:Uncharacterized protein n=1 Tax=Rubripirellula reticaptiva TaxID=2528013 RepID=A0A5C6ENT2_9BACT|nr:DUF6702 family protein [Rubripirellula reticaptiva]TWU49707.1 hypothetical protein Poly59_43310 [Rubripirellula reticaptiva]